MGDVAGVAVQEQHGRAALRSGDEPGVVSRSGDRVVFSDSMRSDIFVRHLHGTGTNLTNDRYSDLDPAWSPDEQLIVYVSDRPDSPEMR